MLYTGEPVQIVICELYPTYVQRLGDALHYGGR